MNNLRKYPPPGETLAEEEPKAFNPSMSYEISKISSVFADCACARSATCRAME
jgi:hypothetical protein